MIRILKEMHSSPPHWMFLATRFQSSVTLIMKEVLSGRTFTYCTMYPCQLEWPCWTTFWSPLCNLVLIFARFHSSLFYPSPPPLPPLPPILIWHHCCEAVVSMYIVVFTLYLYRKFRNKLRIALPPRLKLGDSELLPSMLDTGWHFYSHFLLSTDNQWTISRPVIISNLMDTVVRPSLEFMDLAVMLSRFPGSSPLSSLMHFLAACASLHANSNNKYISSFCILAIVCPFIVCKFDDKKSAVLKKFIIERLCLFCYDKSS